MFDEPTESTQELDAGPVPEIQRIEFAPFSPGARPGERVSDFDLLNDVVLTVRAELGRTHITIEDILKLGAGSLVELNKLAGEPIDLYVNDRLIARGEVVVVDENFGVRVTEIINPARERRVVNG
jgi:flagellar motor switch protein FliN/FliY